MTTETGELYIFIAECEASHNSTTSTATIDTPTMIREMLECAHSIAHRAMMKILLPKNMEALTMRWREAALAGERYAKWTVSMATSEAMHQGRTAPTTGDLLCAIIANDGNAAAIFRQFGASIGQMRRSVNSIAVSDKQQGHTNNFYGKSTTSNRSEDGLSTTNNTVPKQKVAKASQDESRTTITVGRDVNELVRQTGMSWYVVPQEGVAEQIISTLCKMHLNNVAIIGKHWGGKSSLVKYVASKISNPRVPARISQRIVVETLKPKRVTVGMMITNPLSTLRNVMEQGALDGQFVIYLSHMPRMFVMENKMLLEELEEIIEQACDEVNTPLLITADEDEWGTFKMNYPAIADKFTVVEVPDLTEEQITSAVQKHIARYEEYHNATYSQDAIKMAIRVGVKESGKIGPVGNALDILDTAGATLEFYKNTRGIARLCDELTDLSTEYIKLIKETSATPEEASCRDAAISNNTQRREEIKDALRKVWGNNAPTIEPEHKIIKGEHLRKSLEERLGPMVDSVTQGELASLRNLKERLSANVIGQEQAVSAASLAVRRRKVGLGDAKRPTVLFFAGRTGTGKTLLAKELAKELYGNENKFVRLDMSEYSDKTSTNKLIGSSSGYIGYDEGGILTESVKDKGPCVILLDEMEKAHPAVHNMFLQVFDEGRLTDNHGVRVNFEEAIIIMTSNVGASDAQARGTGSGFIKDYNLTNTIMEGALKRQFKPEFIGRIDDIVFFNALSRETLKQIAVKDLKRIDQGIGLHGYSLSPEIFEDAFVENLFDKAHIDEALGARPVLSAIRRYIEDPVVDVILDSESKPHPIGAEELSSNYLSGE